DYAVIIKQIRSIPIAALIGSIVLVVGNLVVVSWRFGWVISDLSGVKPSLDKTVRINFFSLFLTYILPAAVLADLARVAVSCRMIGLQGTMSLRAVVHDRALAILGLASTAVLVLPLFLALRGDLKVFAVAETCACGVLLGAVVLILIAPR